MARARNMKNTFITENPSPFFHYLLSLSLSPLASLVNSPKKTSRNNHKLCTPQNLSKLFLSLLFSFAFLGFSILTFLLTSQASSSSSSSCCPTSPSSSFSSPSFKSSEFSPVTLASLFSTVKDDGDEPSLSNSVMVPLPAHGVVGNNVSEEEREFWKQPDGEGYRPCLDFSIGYRKASLKISKAKRRFLVVVASGGLNQQRNQIVDAVVIARILEAALVVPVLQVNMIWGDER